ncbi:hypothetical protein Despr_1954 [Desulfobulbus propionicus DSM 2032]|jgi:hypothetical protein|uniref:Lipoprotein n=1 Tax=Desulfobulbus propionicus (strain ATCC 33891 / DSM 2032 / VKM B-1956 / 1pr3) TaxID=577650 RepID=A0A7U4DPL3_DESPD|nr:hypothetical protein [Desulfobulbus propionicus]ADW18102.1 hypothetical protein Despr_1954 [Desulfobulbus propionicus DSM 2032]
MKCRLLAAAILLLACGGCVGYYHDPYYYDAYPYGPYYTPYRPPALYADPGWIFLYPNIFFDFTYHEGRGSHRGYPHGGHHRR